ncbi:hypothetical protein [Afipia sp. Root123D2]|uniref:hypothetical protein n=1 Tax=Afipia sp. Root123D2 TaxID=1736436 RepID=UPI00138F139C|nr:hypothetical protein [Afipia sp. Root123D2]
MAMADGARPEDSAKMVCSRESIAYLFTSAETGNRNRVSVSLTASWLYAALQYAAQKAAT